MTPFLLAWVILLAGASLPEPQQGASPPADPPAPSVALARPDPGAASAAPLRTLSRVRPQEPPLSLRADSATGHRAVLRLGPVLADRSLQEAARSGLPLRLTFHIELWRDGFFDSLVDTETWTTVLMHEPLDGNYTVIARANPNEATRAQTYAAARAEIEGEQRLELRPDRPGGYYYTARVNVETLELSDLDELRRWLRGELRPAVSGGRSIPAAFGEGVKRVLIRLLRLPARQITARSPKFRIE